MVLLPQAAEGKKRNITPSEDDFHLKNFNYLAFKRGDEKHFSFLFWKALRTSRVYLKKCDVEAQKP